MVEVDEIFHHVLDGFGAGIDGVNFQPRVAHGLWGEVVQEAVEIEALGGEEVGVGGFIVGGEDEVFEIVRLAEAGVIVGDEFCAEITGPVEDFAAVDGGEE